MTKTMTGVHERDLLKALSDSSIIAFTDTDGTIIYVNDKFCEISKYTRAELLGQDHRIIKSGFHSPEFYADLWNTVSSGKIWTGELKNRAKDGTFYWVFTTIIPFLNDDGLPYQYAAIRIDITERKTLEEARDLAVLEFNKAQLKQEVYQKFVSTLAHDLRSPLAVASMATQLLELNKELPANAKKFVDKILSNIHRVDEMIKDMLNHNLISQRKDLSKDVDWDAAVMIKAAIEDLEIIYGNQFVFKTIENPRGHWSEPGLRRIVENLCSNAVKYGDVKRPVTISLSEEQGNLVISVHNEGKPLLEQEISQIFNYLHRSQDAVDSDQIGWGIGLSLVQEIASAHGGSVEVKSSLNEGTIFLVRIPMDAKL